MRLRPDPPSKVTVNKLRTSQYRACSSGPPYAFIFCPTIEIPKFSPTQPHRISLKCPVILKLIPSASNLSVSPPFPQAQLGLMSERHLHHLRRLNAPTIRLLDVGLILSFLVLFHTTAEAHWGQYH